MSSLVVSKNNPTSSDLTDQNINENNPEDEDKEATEKPNLVTTHIYLKPPHSTESHEKEVVLRRIRQQKRMNKAQTAVKALLTSLASKPNKASVHHKKWVDDAFAAP